MKKCVSFFLVLLSSVASAQNYCSISPFDTAFYLPNGQQYLETIVIDSIIVSGNDTLYYNKVSLVETDTCLFASLYSWLGSAMIVKPGGVNLYINGHNDTISIQTQDTINQNWVMYSSGSNTWTATVVSIQPDSFLGITDTVKYMAITNGVDTDTIQLSKNKGWIKIFSPFQFPDAIINMGLMGFDQFGVQNLTVNDVYNFDPGDEVHTDNILSNPGGFEERKTILIVLTKEIINGTPQYTFENCIYDSSVTYPYDSGGIIKTHIVSTHDTTNQLTPDLGGYSNSNMPYIDSFSSCSYPWSGPSPCGPSAGYNYQMLDSQYNHRRLKIVAPGILCGNDTCYFTYNITYGSYVPPFPYYAIEGVGFFYNTYNWEEEQETFTDNLVYYKKGTETWGTPYTCSELLSVESPAVQNDIVLYPNPASDEIRLSGALLPGATVSIFDLTSKLLRSGLSASAPISIGWLSQGMYFVRIFDSQRQAVYNKVFVKQ